MKNRKTLFVIAVLLGVCLLALSQVPIIICPIHHVPAQFTGRTKKDGEGRTVACEYHHDSHDFWTGCQ